MSVPPSGDDAARQAERDLARLGRGTDGVFSSAAARATRHLSAAEADPDDKVELWGRRVGRVLSVFGALALTILLGRQLGWW